MFLLKGQLVSLWRHMGRPPTRLRFVAVQDNQKSSFDSLEDSFLSFLSIPCLFTILQLLFSLSPLPGCWWTALKSRESACWSDSPVTNEKRRRSDSKINEVSRAALARGALGLFLQGCRRCLTAIYGDK